MHRKLVISEDGSHTIYVEELNEHYHSIHGAFSESKHIFIDAGFRFCEKQDVRILELGFGTGLNALLTWEEATKSNRNVYYYAVEKYPLTLEEAKLLNYKTLINYPEMSVQVMHSAPWDKDVSLTPGFVLHKEQSDIRKLKGKGYFDVIYFDAFAPDVQPDLWSPEVFKSIAQLTSTGGILTTYSVKGEVRRTLISAGFSVEKIPGPKGKREVLRATRH